MANFTTHLTVGTLTSSFLASIATSSALVPSDQIVPVTLAGIIGSIFPDVDVKDSRISQAIFMTLGFLISFCVLIAFAKSVSIMELWVFWTSTLVSVRFGGQTIFSSFTKHRGIWHSILAALFISLSGAVFFSYVLRTTDEVAWTGALFLFLGYMVHLLLDEMCSVDYLEAQIKRSFGTALKFYDPHNLKTFFCVVCCMVPMWSLTPPSAPFVNTVFSLPTWEHIHRNFFPKEKWFAFFDH